MRRGRRRGGVGGRGNRGDRVLRWEEFKGWGIDNGAEMRWERMV